MKTKTDNRGGARPGAGRKEIFSEPTTRIYITVPISKKEEINKKIKKILTGYKLSK